MKDDLQKSDSCGLKSERKKILTSSTCSLACLSTNLGAFCPMVVHLPSEKSILPYFSSPRGVAILDCDSHSQAGSTKATFRKVTPTALKVNVKKIRQVILDPWHVWAPIWVHSAPWGSIFPVKNSFSHIFPAPGGSPHQSLFLRYEIEKGLRAVPQRHQGLVKKLEWIETLFKYRFARSFVI